MCLNYVVLDSKSDNEIFRKNVVELANDPDVVIIVGGNSLSQLNLITDVIEQSDKVFVYPYVSAPSSPNSTSIFYSGGLLSQLHAPFYHYIGTTYPSTTRCIYLLYPQFVSSEHFYEYTSYHCFNKEKIYYDGSKSIQEISDYLDTFEEILFITVMLLGKDLEEYLVINCKKTNGFKEKNVHYYSNLDIKTTEYVIDHCDNKQIESSVFYYSKIHGKASSSPISTTRQILNVKDYNLSSIMEYENYKKIHVDVFGSKILQRKHFSLFVMMNMFLQAFHIVTTNDNDDKEYSKSKLVKELYNLKIETSYTTFSISTTNYLLYPVSIVNMTTMEEILVMNPDTTLINPYGLINDTKQYIYVDYRNGLIRTQETKTVAIVFSEAFIDISDKEKEVFRGVTFSLKNINDKGGLNGYYLKLVCIKLDEIEDAFKDDDVVGYFVYVNSIERKEIYPLFEKYNKLMWYLPNYEGNECKRNIIYTGLYPHQTYDIIENFYQLNSISSVLLYINVDDHASLNGYKEFCGKRVRIIEHFNCVYFSLKNNNITFSSVSKAIGNNTEKDIVITIMVGQSLSNPKQLLEKISKFVNESNIQVITDIYPYSVDEKDRYLLNNTIFTSVFVEELSSSDTIEKYPFVNNSLTQLTLFKTEYNNLYGKRHITDVMFNAYVTIDLWKTCVKKATVFDTDEVLKEVNTIILAPYSSMKLEFDHHVARPVIISKYINNKNRIVYLIDTLIKFAVIENNDNPIISCDFSNPEKPLERIEVRTIPIFIIYKIVPDLKDNYTGVYHSFMRRLLSKNQYIIPDVLSNAAFKTIVYSYTEKNEIADGLSFLKTMNRISLCLLFCPSQDLEEIKNYADSNILFIHVDDYSTNEIVQKNFISFSYNEDHLYQVTKHLFSKFGFTVYITLEMDDGNHLYLLFLLLLFCLYFSLILFYC